MIEARLDARGARDTPKSPTVGEQPIVLRLATLNDAVPMADLCRQLGYAASPQQAGERLARLLEREDHAVWVIARLDGELLGWLHAHLRWSLLISLHAEIGGLVVAEHCRRQGLGGRLMTEAEAWARARGCSAIRLRSNITRAEAHQFYHRLGYRELKLQRAFFKEL